MYGIKILCLLRKVELWNWSKIVKYLFIMVIWIYWGEFVFLFCRFKLKKYFFVLFSVRFLILKFVCLFFIIFIWLINDFVIFGCFKLLNWILLVLIFFIIIVILLLLIRILDFIYWIVFWLEYFYWRVVLFFIK